MKKWIITLLHLGYWLLYSFIVLGLLVAMSNNNPFPNGGLLRALFYSPLSSAAYWPGLMAFYIFYGLLFDRYLKKKRITAFIGWASLTAIGSALLTMLLMHVFFPNVAPFNGHLEELPGIWLFLSIIALVHGIIALIIKGFVTWYNDIQVKMELDRRNYEMEVALIKSQMQPHFLFNTINNIDVLILKNPTLASDYLIKLSDLMRFMLYDTKSTKIKLKEEIDYISKYIDLQRIRTTNNNFVNFEVTGSPGSIEIEPMLFIPFIENAFKHAENKKRDQAIAIHLVISPTTIEFTCENAYVQNSVAHHNRSGLGNELIQRRLSLLFPNKHQLVINDANQTYRVYLSLDIQP